MMNTPQTYSEFKNYWKQHIESLVGQYVSGQSGFIPNLLPEDAVQLPAQAVLYWLEQRYGSEFRKALNPNETVTSPVAHHTDTEWLKKANMVGVNIRTIGSFFNLIKYSLTLPTTQNSIHILPIWEPGVVASLYGITSWNINTEFFSAELAQALPHLNTVEKQLKVTTNLIHLMGRTVGMDVIPHTDRYSEIALANPSYFEWLRRREFQILDHSANLHEAVENCIFDWLCQHGSAIDGESFPNDKVAFFGNQFPEEQRIRVLFGDKADFWGRIRRRNQLIDVLFSKGFEPVPATMAPPYRGLVVSREESAKTVDAEGRVWRDYVIMRPEKMSRVFGPLGRYKLYESKDNNQNWEIDFDQPRLQVWDYVRGRFAEIARTYNFDFMRGDMSHVQMRPDGVPAQPNLYYDIHKAIKAHIQQEKPYFGYFAESFLAPPNTMAYGDEPDHLEASDADSTLGDLQSMVVGTPTFLENFHEYHRLLRTRQFAPNFTVMTADKDDPRFDEFYVAGNELRLFMAFFLTDMPSYMGLGFETRDQHLTPAPNEHYTKLYVFQMNEGKNATHGPYYWGQNGGLFAHLTRLKQYADQVLSYIEGKPIQWLIEPDVTAQNKVIAWTQQEEPSHVFVANLDLHNPVSSDCLIPFGANTNWQIAFSTSDNFQADTLQPGEGRVYGVG
ncbi:MAG: hypothetical protein U0Y10_10305 [Spirosomataceae bacterium]